MDDTNYKGCHDLSYEYDVMFCEIFRELKLDDEEDGPIPLHGRG